LIWTFDPLDSSSYDSILDSLNEFVEKHELMEPNNQYHQMVSASGLPVVAKTLQTWGKSLDTSLKQAGKNIENFFDELREQGTQRHEVRNKRNFIDDTNFVDSPNLFDHDWVMPAMNDPNTEAWQLLYGIANGIFDVFPYKSNPNRCRNNITQAWGAAENWYYWTYDFLGSADDRLTVFKEISYFIELPFGVCYSCYWGFSTIFDYGADPCGNDAVCDENEDLTILLTLGHEIPTNLFYNVGYMYGDVFSLYDLSITA
jgi:hypothetical protein